MLQSFFFKKIRWWNAAKLTLGENKYDHIGMFWCCLLTRKVGRCTLGWHLTVFKRYWMKSLRGWWHLSPFDDAWLPNPTCQCSIAVLRLEESSETSVFSIDMVIPLFHVILTIVPFVWSKRCSKHSCKPFAGEGGDRNLHFRTRLQQRIRISSSFAPVWTYGFTSMIYVVAWLYIIFFWIDNSFNVWILYEPLFFSCSNVLVPWCPSKVWVLDHFRQKLMWSLTSELLMILKSWS